MSLFDFLPYVIALGIAAAIPGPGIAACVGKALGSGFKPAFSFMNGLVLGDLTYLTLAIVGLSAVASVFSDIFMVIRFAGAAYLLWLAWTFWRAGIDPAKMHAAQGAGFWPSFAGGFSITMGNPKTIIFYMALLPTVVDLHTITVRALWRAGFADDPGALSGGDALYCARQPGAGVFAQSAGAALAQPQRRHGHGGRCDVYFAAGVRGKGEAGLASAPGIESSSFSK